MQGFKRVLILLITFFFLNSAIAYGIENDSKEREIQKVADQYLQKLTEEKKFSGSVLIAKEGKIIFNKGYGMANYELNVQNTAKTKFQVGSITKQFTALAVMQLAEKGLLSVKDPISKYFPEYPGGKKITIQNLLVHSSGIWDYTQDLNMLNEMGNAFQPEELIRMFQDKPLSFIPGEKSEYSNSNYVLLGCIVEKLSGLKFEEYISQNILVPIGLHDSGYGDNKKILQNRASGYVMNMGKIENAPFMDPSYVYAAGAMYATAQALYQWDQMLYTEKLLSKPYLDKMVTPDQGGYGYGWKVRKWHGYKHVYHDGEYSGFASQISRFPEQQATVIILSNFYHAPVNEISADLAELLFGKEPQNLEKKEVKIDPRLYQEYIGKYKFSIGMLEIIEKNGKLYAKLDGQKLGLSLLPKDEKTFLVEGSGARLVFVRDPNGKVIEVIGYLNGKKMVGTKTL